MLGRDTLFVAAEQLQRWVERLLRPIELVDLLIDVYPWTGCFPHLTHLSSGEPLTGERKQMLLAAIMGLGLNHGLGKMATTPFSYRQLPGSGTGTSVRHTKGEGVVAS